MADPDTTSDEDAAYAALRGISARTIGLDINDNPYSDQGSREWKCWRYAWMAEDFHAKEMARMNGKAGVANEIGVDRKARRT